MLNSFLVYRQSRFVFVYASIAAELPRFISHHYSIDSRGSMEFLVIGFFGLGVMSLAVQAFQRDDEVDFL